MTKHEETGKMDYEKFREYFNTNTDFLKTIGAVVTLIRDGYAEMEMMTTPALGNVNGTVHGGALYSLADTTAGVAARTSGKKTVTLNGSLNFIHPASEKGRRLRSVAQAQHMGSRTGVFDCKIYDEETLVASGSFTMYYLDEPFTYEQDLPQ